MSPRAFWLGSISGLVLIDIWAHRNQIAGDTCSEVVRELFHTDTRAGQAALIGSWAALTAWLIPHLLKKAGG